MNIWQKLAKFLPAHARAPLPLPNAPNYETVKDPGTTQRAIHQLRVAEAVMKCDRNMLRELAK